MPRVPSPPELGYLRYASASTGILGIGSYEVNPGTSTLLRESYNIKHKIMPLAS